MKPVTAISTLALAGALATASMAQDGPSAQQKARIGEMYVLAINLGVLGAMAKGEAEYDAALATSAANSIAAVSQIDQMLLWPEGSDDMESGHGRALPAIWDNLDDFQNKFGDLATAAAAMQGAAGESAAAIGAAMGGLGGSCQGCHKAYRAPKN